MNDLKEVEFRCIQIEQPIGTFYVGSIEARDLCRITWVDVRRIKGERGFETYLGIQRRLNEKRVKDISNYVRSPDACFPTAVILAVPAACVKFDESSGIMTLMEYEDSENPEENIPFDQIAKVIDGQHRIEGLQNYSGERFEVNVSLFVEMDIADQAYLFSTVNLAQTKVNKSLVFDLYGLARTRSPQKTCHEIAVALDRMEKSPFYERVKRLGVATEGRFGETITQATFVQSLLKYISKDALSDRNEYMNGRVPKRADSKETERLIFRNMFIDEKDLEITDIVWNYFEAVKIRWPKAWDFGGRGLMLNKTNGFKALMRFLKPVYLFIASPGQIPSVEDFSKIFDRIDLGDDGFSTDVFKPGSSGESLLYRTLCDKSGLSG